MFADEPLPPQILHLIERMNDKVTEGECTACGENKWMPGEDLLGIGTPHGIPAHGVEFLSLICGNCGFLRLHAADVLEGTVG